MISLKQKLGLAFAGMLLILGTVGVLAVLLLTQYSSTLERLFRENYDSVVYAQNMKDVVDSLDEKFQDPAAAIDVSALMERFEQNLQMEEGNTTLPGEQDVARRLQQTWQLYRQAYEHEPKREILTPLRHEIKHLTQQVIDINLANIVSVDGQVRERATFARRTMFVLITSGFICAVLFTAVIGRAILRPLQSLTQSVREIEQGNLDLTVTVKSRDELGQLADAFNAMAAKLREYRRSDRAKIFRAQKTTQLALNTFPDAVAIVGMDGRIELANEAARQQFQLTPDADLSLAKVKGLQDIFAEVSATLSPVHPHGYDRAVQAFVEGREHFYLPQGVPILGEDKQLTGVTLVLTDVTELRRLDEMKSSLLSVASHELKTPLTSIRMSTHLLLEERLGPLNPKQVDLLLTARDDAERLNGIIESLLDIGRIESGRALMELKATPAARLIQDAIEPFATAYRDRGVTLSSQVDEDTPLALADLTRIGHVFSNLLGNALKYTRGGGRVVLTAQREGEWVRFSVMDTGVGIPEEALPRIFERFYRAPGQSADVQGAGLGLAIAREIVEAHGGTILAASRPGEGSTFTFTLKGVDHG